MARQLRKSKKAIYVFCEGESEQEYAKCLRTVFADVAALHIPPPVSSGLFEDTKSKFEKGDPETIRQIAARWREAAQRGEEVLAQLSERGMPPVGTKNSDERDAWLHRNEYTFTTVQEAIRFLESLRE